MKRTRRFHNPRAFLIPAACLTVGVAFGIYLVQANSSGATFLGMGGSSASPTASPVPACDSNPQYADGKVLAEKLFEFVRNEYPYAITFWKAGVAQTSQKTTFTIPKVSVLVDYNDAGHGTVSTSSSGTRQMLSFTGGAKVYADPAYAIVENVNMTTCAVVTQKLYLYDITSLYTFREFDARNTYDALRQEKDRSYTQSHYKGNLTYTPTRKNSCRYEKPVTITRTNPAIMEQCLKNKK